MYTFVCRKCGHRGPVAAYPGRWFIHVPWYVDDRGRRHGCLYCRVCGTIHDTIGSTLGLLKTLVGREPSRVAGVYGVDVYARLRDADPERFRLPDPVIFAMREDGYYPERSRTKKPAENP